MTVARLLGGLALLCLAAGAHADDRPLAEQLAEAWRHQKSGAWEEARAAFEDALVRARDDARPRDESEALRGIAAATTREGDYVTAQACLDEALPRAEASGDRAEVGRVLNGLGTVAWYRREFAQARELYERAVAELEGAGDEAGAANTLANLALFLPGEERGSVLDRGLALASRTDDAYLTGRLLQTRGDWRRAMGDYAGALASLLEARTQLQQADRADALVTVLNSLGLLHRLHGRPDQALELQREALALARTLRDPHLAVQSLAGVGNALRDLRRFGEAAESLEEALALATKGGLALWPVTLHEALACVEVERGRPRQALEHLSHVPAEALSDTIDGGRRGLEARALLGLGRLQEALAAADRAVEHTRTPESNQGLPAALTIRARCRLALGLPLDALRDGQEALAALEEMRARLVRDDFMRQGFGERSQVTSDLVVGILHGLGRHGEALETAAQARARAFLDSMPAGPRSSGDAQAARSVAAARLDDVRATARRLGSTLVVYYAGATDVYAWAVPAEGAIASARLPVRTAALAKMVDGVQGLGGAARGRRVTLPTRGGGLLLFGDEHARLRRLYDAVLRPLQRSLPKAPGARVTIVPDGPLFRLPFGALRDGAARYLVERYTIHYGPAVGTFALTAARTPPDPSGRVLLVGDPARFPPAEDGAALPQLPGSRREMDGIARLMGPERVERLQGTEATEARVRERARDAPALHFSTHGVVRDDTPLESFVALEPGAGGEADDGRLTSADVYGLQLRTDLVFLSACRTARGGVSADGVIGLTRAFFHAGAASIVATLWDVADETTQRLVADFYGARLAGQDKATALRTAQLRMLGELRGGRVKVQTAAGPVALPEHPALWASFVLLGEP